MKVALVHELLTMKGGAERVLRILADMFPDAPIYTLLYSEQKLGDWFPKQRVKTSSHFSFLPPTLLRELRWTGISQFYNHHIYLPFFPKAIESFDFSEFDLVISSSSAFAHGIKTSGKTKHLSYVHSPARYLWDRTHDVQDRSGIAQAYLSPLFHRLRMWDAEAAQRADITLAASKEVARRTQLYWNRESEVVYPPIDEKWFECGELRVTRSDEYHTEIPDYFLIVSTLARYKRIDIAIEACNKLGKHLKIIGDGPDRPRLERMAGPTIHFYGHREGDELADLYTHAEATIFPGYEDFGLVPLESMACGTPVIAYRGGGALETVIEGETGAFFDAPTAPSLAGVLQSFDHKIYSKEKCILRAKEFSKSNFEQLLHTKINMLMNAGKESPELR